MKWESSSPRGRIKMVYGWAKGELKPNTLLMTSTYCPDCEQCVGECPAGVPLVEILNEARRELVKQNKAPPKPIEEVNSHFIKDHNVLGKPSHERLFWTTFEDVSLDESDRAESLYFVGCLSSYWSTEIAAATVNILKKAGKDFVVLGGEEWCCGYISSWSGRPEIIEETIKHNNESISKFKVKEVFTNCPGCYRVLKNNYSTIDSVDYNVIHFIDVLTDLKRQNKLKFSEKIVSKVVYHDPCHLGRTLGFYEKPRDIIKDVPGINLIEMRLNRSNARCCGGTMATLSPELSSSMGNKRLQDAEEVGANLLITSCPQCYINLRKSSVDIGSDVEVMDLTMLLAEAMGL
jgi:Fe-S oxidoreductase